MSNKGIEEIIIAAACREPIGPEAQARLEAALRESAHLRELHKAQNALSAELRALGEVLQGVAADGREAREVALLSALRTRVLARPQRLHRGRVPLLAMAAVVAVTALAVAWIAIGWPGVLGQRAAALGGRPPALAQHHSLASGPRAGAARESSAAVFQPLMYAPRPSAWESYSVVRVRIPLSSLAPIAAAGLRGTVDADVLVGEDGLARAIRFDDAQGFPAASVNSGDSR